MIKFILLTAWYELNVIGVIVGAGFTILTFIVSLYFTNKYQSKKERQNTILIITQSNGRLFSLIYSGSLDSNNIEYIDLRNEIEKSNILYVLPHDIRPPFIDLYKIFLSDTKYYKQNKKYIHQQLVDIVSKIEEYGADAFEHK